MKCTIVVLAIASLLLAEQEAAANVDSLYDGTYNAYPYVSHAPDSATAALFVPQAIPHAASPPSDGYPNNYLPFEHCYLQYLLNTTVAEVNTSVDTSSLVNAPPVVATPTPVVGTIAVQAPVVADYAGDIIGEEDEYGYKFFEPKKPKKGQTGPKRGTPWKDLNWQITMMDPTFEKKVIAVDL